MVLAQPVVQPVFQYTDVLVPAAVDEVRQLIAGDGDGHAMHIQLGTDGQAAASELLQFPLLNPGAGEKQGLV